MKTCYFSFRSYGFVSISKFTSLICVPVGIKSSAVELKTCAITPGIRKYKSIIKKREMYDEIVLLGKTKLDPTEVLNSQDLFNWILMNTVCVNVLREYNEMKQRILSPETPVENTIQTWLI